MSEAFFLKFIPQTDFVLLSAAKNPYELRDCWPQLGILRRSQKDKYIDETSCSPLNLC